MSALKIPCYDHATPWLYACAPISQHLSLGCGLDTSSGQLGDGTLTNRLTPTQAQLLNIYFYDLEGDGYGGDLLPSEEACEPPGAEYVENPLDCDDFDPAINPGAAEVCDGLDNNCNGSIDET
ncbi:putative metal-binding motif-containing protein, partial [Archangium violaceum]|uniref:putative metal-binding motif-containing protein n=1 Tax=Archangium violaceum TaxID=83451 RepID=UPI001F271949